MYHRAHFCAENAVGNRALEQGVKRRDLAADTAAPAEPASISQQRRVAEARLFIPTLRRLVLVLGGDAALLLGEVYDDSDLFRYGGATSLRGYDEERFRGNIVGRGIIEYRYQIDRTSYAFLFTDLGYVERPVTAGIPADRWFAFRGALRRVSEGAPLDMRDALRSFALVIELRLRRP